MQLPPLPGHSGLLVRSGRGSGGETEARAAGAAVGRFAPYRVWYPMAVVVRGAQILFLALCLWYLAALRDAMSRPHTISTPPAWLWVATVLIGADTGRSTRRWRTSPLGDAIGSFLAAQHCPACGQDVFDRTPPSGYEPDTKRYAFFPSRRCTNCDHDLARKTAP